MSQEIKTWELLYQLEDDQLHQKFETFEGTLLDAQNHADQYMVNTYGVDLGTGWDMGGYEFSDKWNPNYNYGNKIKVYSRGYNAPEGYHYAVAYVGELDWGL